MAKLTPRFEWIFKHRGVSASGLSHKAGLSRSHVRGLLEAEKRGEAPSPTLATLDAIARAADVSLTWLSSGQGEPGSYDGPAVPANDRPPASPIPPPVSSTVTTRDAAEELVNAAFDPEVHQPSDILPVLEALAHGAPLLKSDQSPAAYVRRLLDVVAKKREKGQRVRAANLPSEAVTYLSEQLDENQARLRRAEERLERARQWILDQGLALPDDDPNAPPPGSGSPPTPRKKASGRRGR